MANLASSSFTPYVIPPQGDRGTNSSGQPGRASPSGRIRLLIVDDDAAIREITSAMLTDQGHEVLTAEDGLRALDLLPQFRPDLVITDLKMPRMSGYELIRIVRERFPQIPVIVVSGEFLPDEIPVSIDADAFLAKGGCFITALEAKIAQLLSTARPSALQGET
jgi:CheY-like chemotaxis protein